MTADRPLRTALACAAALAAAAALGFGPAALGQDSPAPVRLDRQLAAGVGLTAVPGDAYEDIRVAGTLDFRVATLFDGQDLHVSVFESTPATTDHATRHTEGDELVFVQSGKLILTEPDGTRHEFVAGDSLVLPAGYAGTWEMQGDYREIAVTAR